MSRRFALDLFRRNSCSPPESAQPRARSPRLKRTLRWACYALAILILIISGLLLARDPILKAITRRGIEESTGLRAEIGEFKSVLGTAALHVRNLRLYNPADYGGALMADVPELLLDLDLEQLADGRLHFRDITLRLKELNVVKNIKGRFNLEGVEKKIRERLEKRKRRKHQDFDFEYGGIDHMDLTVGKVSFTDMARPQRSRSFELGLKDEVVTNLKSEEDLQRWIGAMLFRILMRGTLPQQAGIEAAEAAAPSEGADKPSPSSP